MTAEYFAALEAEIPVVEAERALAIADASLYPHLRSRDAQHWWNAKVRVITAASAAVARRAGALFVVDGRAVGGDGLRRWFRRTIGRGLAA